jgi:hypothetical protein
MKIYMIIVLVLSIIAIIIDVFKFITGMFTTFDAILMACSFLGIMGVFLHLHAIRTDNE